MTLLVRQREPTPDGLPIQIYCFTATTAWAEYEGIQSDIFDHILAIIPEFDLRVFQHPSGQDLRRSDWPAGPARTGPPATSRLQAAVEDSLPERRWKACRETQISAATTRVASPASVVVNEIASPRHTTWGETSAAAAIALSAS